MDKRFIPVATLVGALALAGCGGGSDTPAAATVPPMPEGMEDKPETSGADTTAAGGATVELGARITNATSQDRRIRIPATGEEVLVSGNYFTCTGDEACVITIPAGESVFEASYTGGTLTASATKKPPEAPAQPESENWLSGPSLVGSVPADGGNSLVVTVNNVKRTFAANRVAGSAAGEGPLTDGLAGTGIAQLWLHHDRVRNDDATDAAAGTSRDRNDSDFLVWGAWIDAATPTATSPKPEHTFGGSAPHGAPTRAAGTATYRGSDVVRGFFKDGSGSWTAWTGDARLVANFGTQKISGAIAGGFNAENAATDPGAITGAAAGGAIQPGAPFHAVILGSADIGASMSGKATIRGLGGETERNDTIDTNYTRNAPSSGTWAGAFFGPTTGDPTGVAGSFSAKRPAAKASTGNSQVPGKWHEAVGDLEVTGAFGVPAE